VNLATSKGPVEIEVRRAWAPRGADHFYDLVKTGFYDGKPLFPRGAQFRGAVRHQRRSATQPLWANANLPDDPVKQSNVRGTLTYAHLGPNSRSTQLFINLKDNKTLDQQGFAPIGKVISGMETVERFYSSYGEMAPRGQGPDPSQIEVQGNAYLENHFARLDYIHKATIQ